MNKFIGLVFYTLKNKYNVDIKNLSLEDAIKKYNELEKTDKESLRKEEIKNHKIDTQELDMSNPYHRLIYVLQDIKNIKYKEIRDFIKALHPVSLEINGENIVARFDKFTANKNTRTQGNSSYDGYKYKLDNYKDFISFIENATYNYSKDEEGKPGKAHKGVKEWHYFNKTIHTDKGIFEITINVRDKGKNKYIYEVSLIKK